MTASRSRYHHGDLRAAVLQQAELTLSRSGVDGLSLRRLARDIGVSHAAPSRHFRDKQALLDALAVSGFERLGRSINRRASSGSFDERLRAVAHAYVHFAIANPALLALMFSRKHDEAPGSAVAQAAAEAFATPIALIVDGQARGDVVAGDPMRIGMTALATFQGLVVFIGSGMIDAGATEELLADAITHLGQGLRPRS
ncbi:TetR/AcrR family transcriptional regulator [Mycobacterium sp. 134]|uniref:TetR/AcrR family transcriptional regulator n=1 Tax=Mycobacterium sp. 134 TaxID=3400425 RepID=UPI003AAAFDA2